MVVLVCVLYVVVGLVCLHCCSSHVVRLIICVVCVWLCVSSGIVSCMVYVPCRVVVNCVRIYFVVVLFVRGCLLRVVCSRSVGWLLFVFGNCVSCVPF